jgi:5,10-methylenetetrahydromethanopterin reductase
VSIASDGSRAATSERVGLALGYDPNASIAQMAAAAAHAEAAGLEMVFFSETLFSNRDSVSALAAFALATRRIALGATQVVRLRSPLLMAQTAASLDELSDGRLVLALGAFTAMHAARHGVELTEPLPTLREYVECVRRLLAGACVSFHGEAVRMEEAALAFSPRRAAVPIWIAANTPQGLANAARIGDGVLLDAGASPEYAANAVAIVRSAAAAAGRDPAALEVAQLVNTSIDGDPRRALDAVRWEIASKFRYPRTPRFKLAVGEPHIDPADLPRFAAAYRDGGPSGLAAALPDSYVAAMSASGPVDAVRERIRAYRRAGVTLPLLRPAAPEQTDRLLDAFGARDRARG